MIARSLRIAGLVGALALLPAAADAQGDRPISVGVMGGLSLPMGDLGDAVESGFNITGSIYFRPAAARMMFRGDVGYDSFSGKKSTASPTSADCPPETVCGASHDFDVLSFTGNVIFPLGMANGEGTIRPYLIGGVGLYRGMVGTGLASGRSTTNTDFGIAAGGGLEFQLAGFSTFAEARFTNVFGDGDSSRWIPITFGIRF